MRYKSDANFVVLARPKLWLAITRAIVSLLAGSPYLLLAYDKYWAVASYQVSSLDFAIGERQPWWWIIRSLVQAEWLLGSLLVAVMLWSFYRREPLDWIFLVV